MERTPADRWESDPRLEHVMVQVTGRGLCVVCLCSLIIVIVVVILYITPTAGITMSTTMLTVKLQWLLFSLRGRLWVVFMTCELSTLSLCDLLEWAPVLLPPLPLSLFLSFSRLNPPGYFICMGIASPLSATWADKHAHLLSVYLFTSHLRSHEAKTEYSGWGAEGREEEGGLQTELSLLVLWWWSCSGLVWLDVHRTDRSPGGTSIAHRVSPQFPRHGGWWVGTPPRPPDSNTWCDVTDL